MSTEKFNLSNYIDLVIDFSKWWGQWYTYTMLSNDTVLGSEMLKYNIDQNKLKELLEDWIREYLDEEKEIKNASDFFNFKINVFRNINYIKSFSEKKSIKDTVKEKVEDHMKKYRVSKVIEWHKDMQDFYSDLCKLKGPRFSKEDVRILFEICPDEFQEVAGCGVLRYAV